MQAEDRVGTARVTLQSWWLFGSGCSRFVSRESVMAAMIRCLMLLGFVGVCAAPVSAQYFVPAVPVPVVAARPVVPVVTPVVPVRSVYAAPTAVARVSYSVPVVAARPVVPVAVARPAVTYRPAVAPVVVTRPVVTPVVPVPAVLVRPRVYYPGQPVRNTLRALAP